MGRVRSHPLREGKSRHTLTLDSLTSLAELEKLRKQYDIPGDAYFTQEATYYDEFDICIQWYTT
jgi:hypothetical protein